MKKTRESVIIATLVLLVISGSAGIISASYFDSSNSANNAYAIGTTDSTIPSIAIAQPTANSNVMIKDGTITLTGTALDSGSGVRVVQVRVDGGSYFTATPKAAGDWSTWTVTLPITSGQHRLVPRATDNAGNQNWNSIYVNAIVSTADSTIPSIAIAQPTANSNVMIKDGTITLTGTALDSGSGVRVVQVRVDGGSYFTATPKAAGDWSTWTVTLPITSGQHRLVPRVTDGAGNQAWNSIFITVNDSSTPPPPPPDPSAPDTRIDSAKDGSGVVMTDGQTTTSRSITTLFSSPDTDAQVFEGRLNSGTWSPITSPITINELATGQNRYDVRARDTAGNVDASPASITWTITTIPPPPSGTLDPFGIVKLYPTAAGLDNEYYTKTNAATTTEFLDNGKVARMSGFSRNADGTWNIDGGPRWVITGGWRNIEMTMQLKINSGDQVQFYANGEEHTTNNNGAGHGSANKMRMYADGRIGFVKELYHESGNSGYASTTATRSSGEGSITGKWVTVKYVGYNIDNDTHRKLEGYISMNNDNKFIKVSELVDNGNWYASSGFDSFMAHMRQNYPSVVPENRDTGQEMKRNEVITWEGGFVSFRCDGADYDFRNVSVREINAANGLIDPSVVQ